MFKLHEAPNLALSAISTEKVKRGCGTLWSWACCLPTFTFSLNCFNGGQKDYNACCYPSDVTLESDAGLEALIDTLQGIKSNISSKQKESSSDTQADCQGDQKSSGSERDIIKWQVEQTIKVLMSAVNQNVIGGSYKTAIQKALSTLVTRVDHENAFAGVITKADRVPLLSDFPTYTLGARK